MTGGRDMGVFVIGVLMMSEFIGSAATMGTAEASYGKGISAAWNLVSMCLAFVLFAYFMASRFQRLGEYTISGAIATRYGERVRLTTSVIMIYALMVVNISMYVGGAATIATILHLPTFTGILITGAVTILYVAVGGIKGVAYTNLIHASIKYFGLIITTVVALRFSGGSLTHLREAMPPIYFSLTGRWRSDDHRLDHRQYRSCLLDPVRDSGDCGHPRRAKGQEGKHSGRIADDSRRPDVGVHRGCG